MARRWWPRPHVGGRSGAGGGGGEARGERHADLPGADPGSIDVSVDNGVLTLSAQRSTPSDEGVQWLTSERFSGTYRRQLTLGDAIDSAAISARYDNGVLTVTIPVAEKAKPRRIEVESAGRPQAIETSTVT